MTKAIKTPLLDAVHAALPPATKEQLAVLTQSVKTDGQMTPIVTAHSGRFVLDGRDLMTVCKRLKINPRTQDLGPLSDEEMARYAATTNAVRKQLPVGTLAALASVLCKGRKIGDNQHSTGLSIEQAAHAYGISSDSVTRFHRVAKAAPALANVVARGTVSLSRAEQLVKAYDGDADAIDEVISLGEQALNVRRNKEATIARQTATARRIAKKNPGSATSLARFADSSFQVVLADPPWHYTNSPNFASPGVHYPTMTNEALIAMGDEVKRIVAQDAVLFLWTTNMHLPVALDLIKAWGFTYANNIVWPKARHVVTPGLVLPCHETLLVARRGQSLKVAGQAPIRSWPANLDAVKGVYKHSEKPSFYADEIERLFPKATKLEMFSRDPRPGWSVFGNEVEAQNDLDFAQRQHA